MRISVITWNTQGNPLNSDEKRADLDEMVQEYDFILLQECGAFAEMRRYQDRPVFGSPQAGALNNRCSTAIIAPVDVGGHGSWTGSSSGRSALWAKYKGAVIATIHCTSGGVGRADLRAFLRRFERFFEGRPLIVGGDFNFQASVDMTVFNVGTTSRATEYNFHTQARATHDGGGILDCFVSQNAEITSGPRINHGRSSDHRALSATFCAREKYSDDADY